MGGAGVLKQLVQWVKLKTIEYGGNEQRTEA